MWRCVRDPIFSHFNTMPACDRHTDTQTHDSIYRTSIVSRGKKRTTLPNFNQILCILIVTVDRSSSGVVAIGYVLSVFLDDINNFWGKPPLLSNTRSHQLIGVQIFQNVPTFMDLNFIFQR